MAEALTLPSKSTLLEVLDRLLEKGVVARGDIMISVADVDLIYLDLQMILTGVANVEDAAPTPSAGLAESPPSAPLAAKSMPVPEDVFEARLRGIASSGTSAPPPLAGTAASGFSSASGPNGQFFPDALFPEISPKGGARSVDIDPARVEKGMARLVLTVVELIRELLERQALRRVERGNLTDRQIENMGTALMRIKEKMGELKDHFGLSDEDLNIHLGVLGDVR